MPRWQEQPQAFLRALFEAALAAVDPGTLDYPRLPPQQRGRTRVVGAGKAAAAMAAAMEQAFDASLDGLVIVPDGHAVSCRSIEVVEASHPVPDQRGLAASRRIIELAAELGARDRLICLLSGGASALLCLPAPPVSLQQKQSITRQLLAAGADIFELNIVRKHLSAIKGGGLARAAQAAEIHTWLISDVPGDDPSFIGSGPTLADASRCADARALLDRYRVTIDESLREALDRGALETPKPGDPAFARSTATVLARPLDALHAAAAYARSAGVHPVLLGDAVQGEAREVARRMAGMARSCAAHGEPASPPCVLLSGGETTVRVRGPGAGGRNTEFLLALGIALRGHPQVHAIACDTDGIDGTGPHAGALLAPDSLARMEAAGLAPGALLDANDSRRAFDVAGGLVETGPTRTNVNDFRALLIHPSP